jgi:hypothetical protein
MDKRYLIENKNNAGLNKVISEELLFSEANRLSKTPVFMLINAIEIIEKDLKNQGQEVTVFELKSTRVDLSIERLKEFQKNFKEEKIKKIEESFIDRTFSTNLYQLSLIYGIPVCLDNFEALRGQEPSPFIRLFGGVFYEYMNLWNSFCKEEEEQFCFFNFGRANTIDEAFMAVFDDDAFEGALFFHLMDDDPTFATILRKQSVEIDGKALVKAMHKLLESHLDIYRDYISNNE